MGVWDASAWKSADLSFKASITDGCGFHINCCKFFFYDVPTYSAEVQIEEELEDSDNS